MDQGKKRQKTPGIPEHASQHDKGKQQGGQCPGLKGFPMKSHNN
jgi:hypothetical protein